MAHIEVSVSCPVERTFRVDQVAGLFDLPVEEKTARSWSVELPDPEEPAGGEHWRIGAIVGPSGSGKSVIARHHYGHAFVESGFDWPPTAAVVDAWPQDLSAKTITGMLNSVGFSSPPDWVKPYRVISNGQRFRCDLARALLTPGDVIAFDEFTSVVDRQVARFGSAAVARTIRKGRAACTRFVAVTCHYDVLPWLQPDWVLDLGAGGRLARGWLQDAKRKDPPRSPLGKGGRRDPPQSPLGKGGGRKRSRQPSGEHRRMMTRIPTITRQIGSMVIALTSMRW